jgi:hypothetical protein
VFLILNTIFIPLVGFIVRREEKFIHTDAAINDYLLSTAKARWSIYQRHHQEHCRLNKDGGNEAEFRFRATQNNELGEND